jgi:hypothetical protein
MIIVKILMWMLMQTWEVEVESEMINKIKSLYCRGEGASLVSFGQSF